MHGSEEDHEEDHLEEHEEDVAFGQQQRHHAEDRADGALDDRKAERVQRLSNAILRQLAARRHVNVANVRRKIYGEADAHDQVNHGNRIKVDVPQTHVADDANFNRNYAKRDPYRAQDVWNENK